ncbi:MAG: glyoxalase superfamily protein [Pseudomonadota bacterium]|nr:glyoxalase superfamily protein [Pseudomonadota bacterium]
MSARTPRPELKRQATRLRETLRAQGQNVSHAKALEAVARQHGYRDWNTASALAPEEGAPAPVVPPPRRNAMTYYPGERIHGEYMGQRFEGEVKSAEIIGGRLWRIGIRLDAAIDVVTFDSFSAFRKHVFATVDEDGLSHGRRSDGTPHMKVLGKL